MIGVNQTMTMTIKVKRKRTRKKRMKGVMMIIVIMTDVSEPEAVVTQGVVGVRGVVPVAVVDVSHQLHVINPHLHRPLHHVLVDPYVTAHRTMMTVKTLSLLRYDQEQRYDMQK